MVSKFQKFIGLPTRGIGHYKTYLQGTSKFTLHGRAFARTHTHSHIHTHIHTLKFINAFHQHVNKIYHNLLFNGNNVHKIKETNGKFSQFGKIITFQGSMRCKHNI